MLPSRSPSSRGPVPGAALPVRSHGDLRRPVQLPGRGATEAGRHLEQANAEVARLLPTLRPVPDAAGLHQDVRRREARPDVRPLRQDDIGDVGQCCGSARHRRHGAADGLRQRRQPVPGARGRAGSTSCRAERARREPRPGGAGAASESLVLGLLGGVLGLGLAWPASRCSSGLRPRACRASARSRSTAGAAFTLAVSLVAGLLFGLIPGAAVRRARVARSRKAGGRPARPTRHAPGTRWWSQIALALVLLVASGLMMRSFQALRAWTRASRSRRRC